MRKYIPIIFTILFVAGCKPNMGSDLLPPAVMMKMLTDIQLAETYSGQVKGDPRQRAFAKNTDSLALYYKEIFAHYKVSQQQFDDNIQWYKAHPEDLDSIYVKMIPELSKYDK